MSNKAREVDSKERKEEDNLERTKEDGASAHDDPDGLGIQKMFRKLFKSNKNKDDKTKGDSDDTEASFKPDTRNTGSDVQPEAKTRDRSPSSNTSGGKPTQESSTETATVTKHGSEKDSGSPGALNKLGVPDDLEYAYNNTRKGYMVILVNETFARSSPRKGSCKDKDMLVEIASCLGFKYTVISNKIQSWADAYIKAISKMDFSYYDCLIFVISSHGDEIKDKKTGQWDHIFLSHDDEDIYTRDVINLFDEKNCPTLKGKPKLFFIQACRGKGTDDGETVEVSKLPQPINNPWRRTQPDSPDAKLNYANLEQVMDEDTMQLGDKQPTNNKRPDPSENTTKSGETSKTTTSSNGEDVKMNVKPTKGMVSQSESEDDTEDAPDTKNRTKRFPKSGDRSVDCGKDMVIVFASISGMMAWRSEVNGSWMLYYFHQTLKATTAPTNLLNILATLNYEMARRQSFCEDYPSWHAKKAIAVILHRLQKKLLI